VGASGLYDSGRAFTLERKYMIPTKTESFPTFRLLQQIEEIERKEAQVTEIKPAQRPLRSEGVSSRGIAKSKGGEFSVA